MTTEKKRYASAMEVARRYGVSRQAVERGLGDLELPMPRPILVQGRRLYCLDELDAWDKARRPKP
jgi:hypothetical protein